MNRSLYALRLGFLILLGLSGFGFAAVADTTIYLVRHAEKEAGPNPSLTAVGQRRAEVLAAFLEGKAIQHIFSTNYARTLETAKPSATTFGVEIKAYDPRALAAFAEELRELKGAILVVGHSNTTPRLFNELTGEKRADLREDQYDHLFEVKIGSDGNITHDLHFLEPRTP